MAPIGMTADDRTDCLVTHLTSNLSRAPHVAMIASFRGQINYARSLAGALAQTCPQLRLTAIVERDSPLPVAGVQLHPTWQSGARAYLQMFRAVRAEKPDVVHVQHELTWYGGPVSTILFPTLLVLLRLAGYPVVTTVHAVVTPWEFDEEFLRMFALSKGRKRKALIRLLFRFIYRSIGICSPAIIVLSPSVRDRLVRGYGISPSRIHVIPIGVPTQVIETKEPSNAESWVRTLGDAPFFLCFGYIHRRKGLEYLIDAFARFAMTHTRHYLVIAGGTLDYQQGYAEEVLGRAGATKVADRIIFTGFVDEQAVQWLHSRCEAAVLPHAYSISASSPLSLAFQYGRPVLGTDLGALRDDVTDGMSGLLVRPRSVDELCAGLERLADDEDLRTRLGAGAARTGQERSWERCARRTVGVYVSVMAPDV